MTTPLDPRTRALVERATRQREAMIATLRPWSARARRVDDATARWRAHGPGLGLMLGVALGFAVAWRPRWLLSTARAALTLWRPASLLWLVRSAVAAPRGHEP